MSRRIELKLCDEDYIYVEKNAKRNSKSMQDIMRVLIKEAINKRSDRNEYRSSV